MKVLVTGSSGFVGKHMVRSLLATRAEVIFCDKADGQDEDLSSLVVAERVVEEADAIIHLASSCSTPGSVAAPHATYTDTVETAVNILEAARKRKVPVIITSSVKARDGMTPYGAAKRMVEIWAQEYRSAYDLPVIINRPGTIYGPGQEGSPESGWIAWFLEAKLTDQTVTINGDGLQVRDLLHVSDYVRLLMYQLRDIETFNTGHIYDVGGGQVNAVTVKQIVDQLELDFIYGPQRYGDAPAYVALNDVPGWSPAVYWKDSGMFG